MDVSLTLCQKALFQTALAEVLRRDHGGDGTKIISHPGQGLLAGGGGQETGPYLARQSPSVTLSESVELPVSLSSPPPPQWS